jgi:hypothetical protein
MQPEGEDLAKLQHNTYVFPEVIPEKWHIMMRGVVHC